MEQKICIWKDKPSKGYLADILRAYYKHFSFSDYFELMIPDKDVDLKLKDKTTEKIPLDLDKNVFFNKEYNGDEFSVWIDFSGLLGTSTQLNKYDPEYKQKYKIEIRRFNQTSSKFKSFLDELTQIEGINFKGEFSGVFNHLIINQFQFCKDDNLKILFDKIKAEKKLIKGDKVFVHFKQIVESYETDEVSNIYMLDMYKDDEEGLKKIEKLGKNINIKTYLGKELGTGNEFRFALRSVKIKLKDKPTATLLRHSRQDLFHISSWIFNIRVIGEYKTEQSSTEAFNKILETRGAKLLREFTKEDSDRWFKSNKKIGCNE